MAPKPEDNANDNGSRPPRAGAQYVPREEAARYDERIAEKRTKNNENNVPSRNGPRMIIDVDDLNDRKPPSVPKRSESADIAAKNRARASSAAAGRAVARPPSQYLDEDAQAKLRARSAFRSPVPGVQTIHHSEGAATGRSLESLDRDIEAKNQARRSLVTGTATKKAAPPAKLTTAPTSSNDDAVAKEQARSSNGPAMIPGVFEEKYNATPKEKDIVFGGRDQKVGTSRGGLDDDALAKEKAAATSPRYIGLDDNYDDDAIEKKMSSAGVGADVGYGGIADKKMGDFGSGAHKGLPAQETAMHGKILAGDPGEEYMPEHAGEFGEFGTMGITIDDVEFNDVEDNKLAVATAVIEEEEDDTFIPAAVEYDPDAKPPLYKNRRFRLYSFLACFLISVAITAVVVPTQMASKDNGESGPTMAPTTFRESLGIQDQIEKFVGSSKLYEVGSPHYKALDWLLHEDPMELSPDAENLLQRYILALFYDQTTLEGPWRSCNAPAGNETADCEFQNILRIVPLAYEPVPAIRWLSEKSECEWAGVSCEGNRTTMLHIRGQKLSGPFPEELGHLTFLRSLNLAWNELAGPLPTSLTTTLKHLINIELHANFFSGTIPEEFFAFENLLRFNLGTNRLTGTLSIPEDASQSLVGAFFFENQITGTIPTELATLSALSYVRLSKNQITGPLPTEIGLMSNLQELWLHKTFVSGSIPTEIGLNDKLQDLRLQQSSMGGEIPDELYDLKMIDRIDLFDANFSGTISTKIAQLSTLDVLRIRGNNFHGKLPTELGLLKELKQGWFHHNDLSGSVPDGLCQLRNASTLRELVVDCSISDYSGFPLVTCPDGCCTQCCNAETKTCVDMLDV